MITMVSMMVVGVMMMMKPGLDWSRNHFKTGKTSQG